MQNQILNIIMNPNPSHESSVVCVSVCLEPSDEGLWVPDTKMSLAFDSSTNDAVQITNFAVNIIGMNRCAAALSESAETFAIKETTLKVCPSSC